METQLIIPRKVKNSKDITRFLWNHFSLLVLPIAFLTIILRVIATDFDYLPGEDPFLYVQKASEILAGNWVPTETHGMGWSIVLAPFMNGVGSVMEKLRVAIALSLVLESLTIIPMAGIAKELAGKKWAMVCSVLYCFWLPDRVQFVLGGTEGLFMILMVSSLYFLVKAFKNWKFMIPAMLIAGLMVPVRPNGVVMPVVLAASYSCSKLKKDFFKRIKHVLMTVPFFLVTAAPFILLRAHYHGLLNYGANSKYFVDSYAHVWAENIEGESLISYLFNSSFAEIFDRFVIHGAGKIAYQFMFYAVSPIVLVFFAIGALYSIKEPEKRSVVLSIVVFLIALVPVYAIISLVRYIIVVTPLVLIMVTIGMKELTSKASIVVKKIDTKLHKPSKKALFFTLMLITVSFMTLVPRTKKFNTTYDTIYTQRRDASTWNEWMTSNLHDSRIVFTYLGASYAMLDLADTQVGGRALFDYYSPSANITTMRSGYFETLDGLMEWMKEKKATHVFVGDHMTDAMEPVTSLINDAMPEFTLVYSNHDTDSEWKVKIFAFHP